MLKGFLKRIPEFLSTRATEKEWEEMNEGVQKGMKEGWIRPVVQKTYEIADAFQAHRDVIVNSGSKGKLVIRCQ